MVVEYPNFSPVIVDLWGLKIHWYGLMYVLAFFSFITLGRYKIKKNKSKNSVFTNKSLDDFLFYGFLGVIFGGRIGYCLFYNFTFYISNPIKIFFVWEGGMSFHGGLLGVIVAVFIYARKKKIKFFSVTDFIAPLIPIGLGLGRVGNFINGELWGRPTNGDWGMIFYHVDGLPRHPSQLYQFFLEGILMFFLIWFLSNKVKTRGMLSGIFLITYGIFRYLVEVFREPDAHLGLFLSQTYGQVLSIPMIIFGMLILYFSRRGHL